MSRKSSIFQIAAHSLLLVSVVGNGVGGIKAKCIDGERQALLKFKDDLDDQKDILSSWSNEEEKKDCCLWNGIRCNNKTGHVVMLDLSYMHLTVRGKYLINPPLIELRHLKYLNLSSNDLSHLNQISSLIGNNVMFSLQKLDLSTTQLQGLIPEAFGNNMTSLSHLDLSYNDLRGLVPKSLRNMTLLKHLDLHGNHLEGSIPEDIGYMTPLTYLDLGFNNFKGSIPVTFGKNLTILAYLDLSKNKLRGSIPEAFGKNLTSLRYLDLRKNKLIGSIPEAFGDMSKLEQLDIGFNQVSGEIPKSIFNICTLRKLFMNSNNLSGHLPELNQSSSTCTSHSLQVLYLRENQITGSFPSLMLFSSLRTLDLSSNHIYASVHPSVGKLSELRYLNISNNLLEGFISEAHFLELSELTYLDLSSNKLIFNVSSAWVPSFELLDIRLSSCKLGPKFPRWLQTQDRYSWLDISNTSISDSIPSWFWVTPIVLIENINLSNNQLSGTIGNNYSTSLRFPQSAIDLSYNQLEGEVPLFLFRGTLVLSLSRNKFSSIDSMCGIDTSDARLKVLDISHNQLSGKLTNCLLHFQDMVVANFANNYELSGEIPTSIGSLIHMKTLHLGSNKFTGKLPGSLKKCKRLAVIDVGDNMLSGQIPVWIGEVEKLAILNLRSNQFHGNIPSSLCHLSHLQLLDLSINSISGNVPNCIFNFSSMRSSNTPNSSTAVDILYYGLDFGTESSVLVAYAVQIQVIWKRILSKYQNTLGLVKGIDLSTNMLNGKIPSEITELVGLIYFNLSRNNLSGPIPRDIGNLKLLDFFDLSNNRLTGQIPPSLALIDRLSLLDLSNNNLSGKIPTSTQLQSFNVDAYLGNVRLCGAPLPKTCQGDEEPSLSNPPSAATTTEQDEFISTGFYVSVGVGYAVGFWGVFGTLLLNRSWRFAYFKLLNHLANWIYVMAALHKAKLLRALRR